MSYSYAKATREQVINKYVGEKVSFEHWAREVADKRTWNGVRHIKVTHSKCRLVDGIPTVTYRGEDFELKAHVYPGSNGRDFICLPTIK